MLKTYTAAEIEAEMGIAQPLHPPLDGATEFVLLSDMNRLLKAASCLEDGVNSLFYVDSTTIVMTTKAYQTLSDKIDELEGKLEERSMTESKFDATPQGCEGAREYLIAQGKPVSYAHEDGWAIVARANQLWDDNNPKTCVICGKTPCPHA